MTTIKSKLHAKNLLTVEQAKQRLAEIPGYTDLLEQERAALRAAKFIENTRKSADISQSKLGELIGVSQARIAQMEKGEGRYGPSIDVLERIARACGGTLQLTFNKHLRAG